jgi:uncharacterized protein (TIGR00369 family)
MLRPEITPEELNARGAGYLPQLVGIEIVNVSAQGVTSRLALRRELLAPNGYLHAATVIALADTTAGYGTIANLPQGAKSFTTVELKSNFVSTAREGTIACNAVPVHLSRMTQLWDATVTDERGRTLALFRCTQMILWDRG